MSDDPLVPAAPPLHIPVDKAHPVDDEPRNPDAIIERLRQLPQYVITIQDREGYTYERGCGGQPMNYTGILLEDAERLVEDIGPDFVDRMVEKRAAFAAGRAAERAADGDYRELLDAARSFIQRDDVREMAAPTKLAWLVNLAPRSSVPSDPNQP